MPKKKIEFPEDEKEEKFEDVWDIRKVLVGLVVLVLLIFGGLVAKRILLHESIAPETFIPHISLPSVLGTNTGPTDSTQVSHIKISLPNQEQVQNQIQTIQQQVTHMNVQEIATSSPQVQQILKQIQDLPGQGTSQVKDACVRLCNNL